MTYDLAIIGAGPAGATLARLVGDRYKVLLVDRRRFAEDDLSPEAFPTKCCGGLLAPDAQRMLSRFGLGLPRSVLIEPQLFVVRVIDVPRQIERYYQRYYINMDREAFDRWLVSLVPRQVELRFGCRFKDYRRDGDSLQLTLDDRGHATTESARLVVGADGAASRLRGPVAPAYCAVQEWVEADGSQPYFSALFDPEITDYYCWTIPKGRRLLIGAALRPKDETAENFERLKHRLRTLGYRFGRTVHREATFLRRPRWPGQLSTGQPGIALVGEAGDWISPSSAEGFSYAFRTALALAESLRQGLDGCEHRYHRQTRGLARNILAKSLKARLIFSPTLRGIALRSGINSIELCRPGPPSGPDAAAGEAEADGP